jgi:phage terminase large subunit
MRYRGAHGGRGSGKSWFFGELLIDRFLDDPTLRAVCIREFQKSLEMSAKRLLEDIIERLHVQSLFRVLNTHIETKAGGTILFQGMATQTAQSIKSLEGFRIAWLEEAQSLSQRSLDLLRPTIRDEGSEIWASWNPDKSTDPIDQLLRADPPPDAAVVGVQYHDNPFFPDTLRREMEYDRARDPEKYAHIWLGAYARHTEARVFKNWRVEEFVTPADAAFLFGADWGFAVDPTVAVRGYVQGRTLFVDQEVYRVGCDIDDTPALFDGLGCTVAHTHDIDIDRAYRRWQAPTCSAMMRPWQVLADSARPETISYMQRHGYPRVEGARTGPGSVEEGVEFLKSYDIVVHPRCTHVVDELTAYAFKTHPLTGQVIPVLVDAKNHTIDSLRYMVEPLRAPVQDGSLVW